MSDFLLSEFLILSLLLPVLLRPFIKPLKKGQALPILPFLSIFVCICVMIGQGIVLSFCILCCVAVLVALSEVIRAAAFFHGVLNDFYALPSAVLRVLLLCFFCAAGWMIIHYSPEAAFVPDIVFSEQPICLPKETGNPVEARLIIPHTETASKTLIVVAAAFPFSSNSSNTARMFADAGVSVLEITRLYKSTLPPRFEVYRKVLPLIMQPDSRFPAKETDENTAAFFDDFLLKAVEQYGQHKQAFLYTEGVYSDVAAHFCLKNQGVFSGVFFNLSEEEPLPCIPKELTVCAYAKDGGMPVPPDAKRYQPFYYYIHPHHRLAGFGSLRADDILAAQLLGSGRDLLLKDRQAVVDYVVRWLHSRQAAVAENLL